MVDRAVGKIGRYGYVDSTDVKAVDALLETLSPSVSIQARVVLTDPAVDWQIAYDPALRRAYCFRRQGPTLIYQWWNEVPSDEIAGKLFAAIIAAGFPFPDDVAERIYRDAVETG